MSTPERVALDALDSLTAVSRVCELYIGVNERRYMTNVARMLREIAQGVRAPFAAPNGHACGHCGELLPIEAHANVKYHDECRQDVRSARERDRYRTSAGLEPAGDQPVKRRSRRTREEMLRPGLESLNHGDHSTIGNWSPRDIKNAEALGD